jgi:type IV pilus assembly protein PilB
MNPWAEHFGTDEVDLSTVDFTPELLACIPAEMARRYRVLPISNLRSELWISMADPSDPEALDSLHQSLQRELVLCISEANQIDEFIERLYGPESRG